MVTLTFISVVLTHVVHMFYLCLVWGQRSGQEYQICQIGKSVFRRSSTCQSMSGGDASAFIMGQGSKVTWMAPRCKAARNRREAERVGAGNTQKSVDSGWCFSGWGWKVTPAHKPPHQGHVEKWYSFLIGCSLCIKTVIHNSTLATLNSRKQAQWMILTFLSTCLEGICGMQQMKRNWRWKGKSRENSSEKWHLMHVRAQITWKYKLMTPFLFLWYKPVNHRLGVC